MKAKPEMYDKAVQQAASSSTKEEYQANRALALGSSSNDVVARAQFAHDVRINSASNLKGDNDDL